ncbi:MAG: hypothetical protein NT136_03880 [Candidatus Moranbacteria bacterium]|nr:hypothetical protein [Candidatus Moranbacteria bacterium]
MERKIILSFIIILLASFFYLAYVEQRQADYDYQKNWWVVYFENPKGDLLDFVIENHSSQNNFHWEVLAEKDKVKEGDVNIAKGVREIIKLNIDNSIAGKITVSITSGEEKKEIYKNFEK